MKEFKEKVTNVLSDVRNTHRNNPVDMGVFGEASKTTVDVEELREIFKDLKKRN